MENKVKEALLLSQSRREGEWRGAELLFMCVR